MIIKIILIIDKKLVIFHKKTKGKKYIQIKTFQHFSILKFNFLKLFLSKIIELSLFGDLFKINKLKIRTRSYIFQQS